MLGEDIQLWCEDGEMVLRPAAQTSTANKIEQMQRTAASTCRRAAAAKTDERPLGADRVYESKTKVRAGSGHSLPSGNLAVMISLLNGCANSG